MLLNCNELIKFALNIHPTVMNLAQKKKKEIFGA